MAGVKGKSGRTPGTPNKVTREAREAIAAFVDGNAHRLQEWLDGVARGVPNPEGGFIVSPNPEKAFQMFQSVVEYHVPKLSRAEVNANVNLTTVEALKELNDSDV